MLPTVSRYLTLGNTLLVTATFAGTLTFTVLLTAANPPTEVQSLLGFASALFLASITSLFPILLALQRYSDNDNPQGVFLFIVIAGYTIITAFMSVAFILLMIVLKHYTVKAAFVLGIVLLGISTSATLGMALWNLVHRVQRMRHGERFWIDPIR
jgi:hypothetical protein